MFQSTSDHFSKQLDAQLVMFESKKERAIVSLAMKSVHSHGVWSYDLQFLKGPRLYH